MSKFQEDQPRKPPPFVVLQAVISLRKAGFTYVEIGRTLGISSVQARRLLLSTRHYEKQPEKIQGADGKWRPSRYFH